jgi:hypothetical protein
VAQDRIYLYGDNRVVRPSVCSRSLDAFNCFIHHPFGFVFTVLAGGFVVGGLLGYIAAKLL